MADVPVYIADKLKAVVRRIEEAAAFDGIGNENFNDSTSIKSLVRTAGMSERSLRNWFKLYTGKSISRYASKRRTEYAARIFRLFPNTSKSKVSEIIGLNSSNALYPFLRKNGIQNIDGLRTACMVSDSTPSSFRCEYLPDCVMFYTLAEAIYDECSTGEFEAEHWDKIDSFILDKFPDAVKIGDVGFAIDRYVQNRQDEGIFISGVLCGNIPLLRLSCEQIGDIGWRRIPGQKYVVFTHKGDYQGLSNSYHSALHTLQQRNDIQINISGLIMEKYLNSPVDTPAEELLTEIWVPVINFPYYSSV